jgi:hypothetical protein
VTLLLKRRIYETAGNHSFYLTDINPVGGITHYTLGYNTTDGRWDKTTFTDKIFVDEHIISVMESGPELTVTLLIKRNQGLLNAVPEHASILTLGGGLMNRSFYNYSISLDSSHSERVKVNVDGAEGPTVLDLKRGDLAYFEGLELGVLKTRMPGGYAQVYVLSDPANYELFLGERYCKRADRVYANGRSLIINKKANTTVGDYNLTVDSVDDKGVLTVKTYLGGSSRELRISCGSKMVLGTKNYNLLWYGRENLLTAKLVEYS